MADTTLTFDILARDRTGRTFDNVGRKSHGLAKTLGGLAGIAAGVGIVGGVTMLTSFVKDAAEAAKISRITAQAIKSTGGAAKITASQVADLSQALSNKTAVDDELVQTGANLLLTFKNIRNEAGKGNDIFNQATAAALDLSAAGFGSVESASKMLGKALNDPLRGLTALGRAGVTFTDQQKETIRTLVEQGDILGAQRVIMEEIATQVGGAAEAAASPMEKLKTIMANLGEELGTVLLPYLEDFAEWLIAEGVPKVESMIATFKEDWLPVIKEMATTFKEVWLPAIKDAWEVVSNIAQVAWDILKPIYDRINEAEARWAERGETIKTAVSDAWQFILRTFEDGVRGIANFMLDFAQFILDGVETAFGWTGLLDEQLATAQESLDQFRRDVNRTLSQISDEDIVINIKPGGLERVARQSAAAYASRYQGGNGGSGGGGLPPMRAFTSADAVGGSLGIRTTGLDAKKIGNIVSKIGDRAGTAAFAELQRLFKAGAFFGPGGPGIPGSGRLFPLPPGTYRRSQGPHDGGAIDYAAPFGTPIRASFTGFLDVGDLGNRSYGKFYRLFGAGQRSILGAHLSSFARGDGPIQRGQLIGRVGSTGNSTGNHLHLLGFDSGGWLPTGLSLAYNGTGRPERVLPPRSGGGTTVLELRSSGSRTDDLLLELLRRSIRVRGGNAQVVLGTG